MTAIIKYILLFFCFISVAYAQSVKYRLTITVSGIQKVSGNIEIALYNNAEDFPKDNMVYLSKTVPVKDNKVDCSFYVSQRYYAIALYHDENSNKKNDKNFLGIPIEQFGFSNNAKPKLKAPSFESCKFLLNKDKHITIELI